LYSDTFISLSAINSNMLTQFHCHCHCPLLPCPICRVCLAVFTSQPVVLQLYLNGEPLFTVTPNSSLSAVSSSSSAYYPGNYNDGSCFLGTTSSGAGERASVASSGLGHSHSHGYSLVRHRHSAGEVSCVCIDQFVSLPANAQLAVHYSSRRDPLNTSASANANARGNEEPLRAQNVKGFLAISKL
jgi:hypothetical protein